MIDSKYRGFFQPIFDVLSRVFIKLKISADSITVIGFIVGVGSGIAVGFGKFYLAILLLLISGLFDVIDGTVARMEGKTSPFGAYMDLVFDRLVESSVVLGFLLFFPEHSFIYAFFLVSMLFNFTTFLLAGALFVNEGSKSIHYDSGWAERTETFITFVLMMMFQDFNHIILIVFTIIVIMTGIKRFYNIAKYVKRH
jgi:phosphatidylglycerophosphate synthase